MELSLFERCRKKKLTVQLAVWLFVIALFYAAVCTPISRVVASDILLADTVVPLIIDVLGLLCNYLFYWAAFAFLLYAVFRLEIKNSIPLLAVYAGAVVFRYLANQIADFCVFGFPSVNDFFSLYLPYCLIDMLLDLAQIAVAVLLILCLKKRAANAQTAVFEELPVTKLFDYKKTVLRAGVLLGIIPATAQLISRVIYDIWYGAPTGLADLLWMIVSYLSDLAFVLIGYAVIVLFLNRFCLSEKKAKLEYDSANILEGL